MKQPKKIFIAPLDWGLGHATRCIPIAIELNKLGHEVVFGVNDTQKALLIKEIPFASFIKFEGYNIQYPKYGSMTAKMLIQIPKIMNRIQSENKELSQLISKHNFDLVISDNRFGLYTDKVPCIYITHQINIQAPVFKQALHSLHGKYIQKYSYCWIPDYEDKTDNLAGELSHQKLLPNCSYINPISRFSKAATNKEEDLDYLAIISGPEPQRSLFEKIILQNFEKSLQKCAILGGTPLNQDQREFENIEFYPHLNTEDFYQLVCRSKNVICRPGYSSIMDLHILQKPIHLVPTPGQTEQEYLAKYHEKNGIEWSQQNDLKLSHMLFHKLPEAKLHYSLAKEISRILQ